ncbi:MAG TPA: YfhO family protein [Phototrophicaceae bacterium]|nr:YfhO family protein [Phototrophicaceae bacterium]
MRTPHWLKPDLIAVIALILLWLLFYWRLFTPNAADQASLKQGDFSGQFVTFAGYQYQRFAEGQVPLWNPYNNGGLPFIADTQAAVFYPPRLVTIALSKLAGGWTYHALELEMTFHVLAFTLLMYAFVKRLTRSVLGAFIATIIAGYGGYLSGYPPLQLALLEAGIWLPLAALGLFEATRGERIRWRWLVVTGCALGLSWMAGHSQTSFFLTYLLIAYFAYRVWTMQILSFTVGARRAVPLQNERIERLIAFIIGVAIFGVISFGLASVQLLPGFEYLARTTRAGFGYDAKSNGFPLQDIAQMIVPGVVSEWSPLWIGMSGLILALIALWRRASQARFWGIVALFALLWSFGANSALYPLLYNILPGLYFFRGQERAAYLVVDSLAILAGLGAAELTRWDSLRDHVAGLRLRLWLNRAFTLALALGALIFIAWIGNTSAYTSAVRGITLTIVALGVTYFIVSIASTRSQQRILWALALLVVFELFTFNLDSPNVYDHVPPPQQISMSPPPLIAQVAADTDTPFRVDGARGLTDNFGSLYDVADINGISPLFMEGPYNIIQGDVPDPVSWEVFAVRYVLTDWKELPIPSTIVGTGTDRYGAINLHQLTNPRPFAQLMYSDALVGSDDQAYAMLKDPNFNVRQTIILQSDPGVTATNDPPQAATVTSFAPEAISIQASTPKPAILSIAIPQYPGWYATIDGTPTDILRAYGALSAVVVPAGDHTVQLTYNPLSYRIGVILSLVTWIALVILGIILLVRTFAGAGNRRLHHASPLHNATDEGI